MKEQKTQRITITLPIGYTTWLERATKKLGMSKSKIAKEAISMFAAHIQLV